MSVKGINNINKNENKPFIEADKDVKKTFEIASKFFSFSKSSYKIFIAAGALVMGLQFTAPVFAVLLPPFAYLTCKIIEMVAIYLKNPSQDELDLKELISSNVFVNRVGKIKDHEVRIIINPENSQINFGSFQTNSSYIIAPKQPLPDDVQKYITSCFGSHGYSYLSGVIDGQKPFDLLNLD